MSQKRRPYKIGFLGTMALIGSTLILMYAGTFPTENVWVIVQAVLFCVVGIVFAMFMVGLKIEPFNLRDAIDSIMWTAISFGAIYLVNKTVPFRLEVAPLSDRLFSVFMGVSEETFFRVWLCTFIAQWTKQDWLAIIISSGIWSLYHIHRYGAGGLHAFWILFFAGCVLGWVMLASRKGDGVMFAHAVVNFLA